ncbi:MAG: rhodanese-like domain-containing protein [Bacteriovoracaceae bacterium]|nr:rhodanese-like domain-containing protein [Bacteriovoracaceae bacterium]
MNLKCDILDGVPTVSCENLASTMKQNDWNNQEVLLVDVRRPDEFNGELSHIENASLYTLGPALTNFLESKSQDTEIIFICRSGARSAQATLLSRELGFQNTYNLGGGMLRWNALGLSTTKD